MAEEFILDWNVDQPAVLSGRKEELYAMITIRPNISKLGALLENAPTAPLPAHLVVVVDVSGSMKTLIRDDPHARTVGSTTAEGMHVNIVESSVESRLSVAHKVVAELAEKMGPTDRMTLIAFDHDATCLASEVGQGFALKTAISQLLETGGGGTSMGRGLQLAIPILKKDDTGKTTRKLIVLTDGEDQEPAFALEQAQIVGETYHVPIHAFGTGECRVDFLTNICKTTLGGEFRNITHEDEATAFFEDVLARQKNILSTNTKLTLWLSPEILVKELFRTKPEILYVGKMKPNANNQIEISIEYMEKGKAYEFLFCCEVPARDAGRFRLAKATLQYDIPTLLLSSQTAETNIAIEYTADVERAQVRVGDVRRVISQAEVQRQVLFLQQKIDAIKMNTATEKDKVVVARLLDSLIAKFAEIGDQQSGNLYEKMRTEFQRQGTISQQMLNQSLAASSKVGETVGVTEIDDF